MPISAAAAANGYIALRASVSVVHMVPKILTGLGSTPAAAPATLIESRNFLSPSLTTSMAVPSPIISLPSASMTCDVAVGIMLRIPSL